jgi:threonine/homoserine/homoserine lactone efflux protein
MDILPGLLTIMTMHFLAVVSPGPDFAIVVRNSLTRSHKYALATAFGVSAGLIVHISYCILGLNIIIGSSPKIFTIMKYIGGCYLLYLSVGSLRAAIKLKQPQHNHNLLHAAAVQEKSLTKGFFEGFMCNILNVKAILFILFLFSTVINKNKPILRKLFYVVVMVLITLAWFWMLTFLIAKPKLKDKLSSLQFQIQLTFSIILGGLGIFVLLNN